MSKVEPICTACVFVRTVNAVPAMFVLQEYLKWLYNIFIQSTGRMGECLGCFDFNPIW